MTPTLLCKKKTPFFDGVLFRGGEGDDPLPGRLPGGDRLFFVYFFSLLSVSCFTRAVERVDYAYCTFRADEAKQI